MAFFKISEKRIAKTVPNDELQKLYEHSERKLLSATRTGDLKTVKEAMKAHHKYEYSMLYKSYDKAKGRKKK